MTTVNHVVIPDNDTITKHTVIGLIVLHKQICSLPVGLSYLALDVTEPSVYCTCVIGLDVDPQERFTASHTPHPVTRGVRCAFQIIVQDPLQLCASGVTSIHH